MHDTLPMHDSVLEEVILTFPFTTPLELSLCENSQIIEKNISPVAAPRTFSRPRIPFKKYVDFLLTKSSEIVILEQEPTSYKDALTRQNSEKWLGAMNSEMESMSENEVWDLVDFPNGVKRIGCKLIFKLKTDKDENISVFKARLVVKGCKQVHGIDYDETFSLVAMLKSIQILLAIAAFYDYEIWQMDVKTAFLNGFLEEDNQKVFMIQKIQRKYVSLKNPFMD